MSVYKELVDFAKKNKLNFQYGTDYDAKSGWTLEGIFVFDGDVCLLNMNGNGFGSIDEKCVESALAKLKEYVAFRDVKTEDDFRNYVKRYGKKMKEWVSFPEL